MLFFALNFSALKHGFYLACFLMQKKAFCFVLFGFMCLFISAYAQVPLFIDETDTLYSRPDTVGKKQVYKRANSKNGALLSYQKNGTRIDSLINIAFSYYGNRYRRGGTGAKGFDCSGFTMVVFREMGIKLPHTSAGQGLIGFDISRQNIQKGDLILFRGGNRRSRRIGHVGIVISEKGEPVKFIHSSTSEGVRVDQLDFAYYKNRYVKTVRVPELYK